MQQPAMRAAHTDRIVAGVPETIRAGLDPGGDWLVGVGAMEHELGHRAAFLPPPDQPARTCRVPTCYFRPPRIVTTRSPNALVPSGPPRSGVRHSGFATAVSSARSIRSAA